MFLYDRPVRFEEVDAARIVFFPRVLAYCHEAMAELMAALEGGYAGLINDRRLGLPTVRVEVDFTAPLRFGDVARIAVAVARLGRSSCTFEMNVSRAGDGTRVARVMLTCALTDLSALKAVPIPEDIRAILVAHAAAPA